MGWFSKNDSSGYDRQEDLRRAREEAKKSLRAAEVEYERDPHPISKAYVDQARAHLNSLG